MKALKLLFLAISLSLLPLGGGAAEKTTELALEEPPVEVSVPDAAPTPEPSSTFLAGLGGLVLLFFVLRRK